VRDQLAGARPVPTHAGADAVAVAGGTAHAHLHPAVAVGVGGVAPQAQVALELGLDDVQSPVVVKIGHVRTRLARFPAVGSVTRGLPETGGGGRGEGHVPVVAVDPHRIADAGGHQVLPAVVVEIGGDDVAVVADGDAGQSGGRRHVREAARAVVAVEQPSIAGAELPAV